MDGDPGREVGGFPRGIGGSSGSTLRPLRSLRPLRRLAPPATRPSAPSSPASPAPKMAMKYGGSSEDGDEVRRYSGGSGGGYGGSGGGYGRNSAAAAPVYPPEQDQDEYQFLRIHRKRAIHKLMTEDPTSSPEDQQDSNNDVGEITTTNINDQEEKEDNSSGTKPTPQTVEIINYDGKELWEITKQARKRLGMSPIDSDDSDSGIPGITATTSMSEKTSDTTVYPPDNEAAAAPVYPPEQDINNDIPGRTEANFILFAPDAVPQDPQCRLDANGNPLPPPDCWAPAAPAPPPENAPAAPTAEAPPPATPEAPAGETNWGWAPPQPQLPGRGSHRPLWL